MTKKIAGHVLGAAVMKLVRTVEKLTVDIAKPPTLVALATFDPSGVKPGSKCTPICGTQNRRQLTFPLTKSLLRNLKNGRVHRKIGGDSSLGYATFLASTRTLLFSRKSFSKVLTWLWKHRPLPNETRTELAKNARTSFGESVRMVARNKFALGRLRRLEKTCLLPKPTSKDSSFKKSHMKKLIPGTRATTDRQSNCGGAHSTNHGSEIV